MISKKRAKKMTDAINTKLTIGTRWRIFWFIHWWVDSRIKEAINAGHYRTSVYIDEFNKPAQDKIAEYISKKGYKVEISKYMYAKLSISWED